MKAGAYKIENGEAKALDLRAKPNLVSSCCGRSVPDLAGEGVGGVDICPDCGEWATIEKLEEDKE